MYFIELKLNNMDIELAKKIARVSFKDKKDKGGNDYYLHLERVARNFSDDGLIIISYLHYLLEDCPEWNEKSLMCLYPEWIVKAIVTLTRRADENYSDYIKRIKQDDVCTRIKTRDLEDNMNITRLNELTKEDFERLKKYLRAYNFLKDK